MERALPYAGWALLGAVLVWAGQKFFGKWLESAASALEEWFIGRLAAGHWLRSTALRRYAAAVLEDYDKVPVPFIEREDQRPSTRKIYVPLQTVEDTRRLEDDAYENVRRSRRSVVLGPPGSGKSMLLKNSILIWAEDTERVTMDRRAWGRSASRRHSRAVPVLVEVRRCLPAGGVAGVKDLIINQFADHGFARAGRFVDRALYDGDLTILFDGLDEVVTPNREAVCDLLTTCASRYAKCQMVVTCRSAIYQGQLSDKFANVVRVADFDDAQIRRFMRNWRRSPADQVTADQLLDVLRDVPRLMQLARNPLLLTLIAYLYAYRGKETRLPRSRSQFYKEATDFLLRNKPELDYSQGAKMVVLQRLALTAQDAPAADMDRQVLPYTRVVNAIKTILPATTLRREDIEPLLDEIVTRSGIIKQIRGEQSFHFAHLTLQEFLAAVALGDQPDDLIHRYRSDPAIWRETIKLWCGYVSRDSKPVVGEVFNYDPVLAFECLADAVQIDETVARKITEYFAERLGCPGADDDAVVKAFGAVASDPGPKGETVLGFLIDIARMPGDPRQTAAIRALAASKLRRAAEVLTELDTESAVARDSLRTMGGLAIPAYVGRARKGQLTAVDDLAAIGTPAAARELVLLLGADIEVATRAAWRIGTLIRSPDIEEALRASDDLLSPPGSGLDYVWAPFCEQSATKWLGIMGRVAYLINESRNDEVPDVVNMDRRMAIPLCFGGVCGAIASQWVELPNELISDIERASGRQLRSSSRPSLPRWMDPNPLRPYRKAEEGKDWVETAYLRQSVPCLAEDTFLSLIRSLREEEGVGVRKAHWLLFAELTPNVQRQLFENACRHPYSQSDSWRDVFTHRSEPKVVKPIVHTLAGTFAATVVGLGIWAIVEVLLGNWIWGPSWLPWIAVSATLLFVVGSVVGNISEGKGQELPLGHLVGGASCSIACILLIFYGTLAIREYFGWPAAICVITVTTIVLGALLGMVANRIHAAANPFWGLLEIDEQATRSRTSIVA